MLTFLPPARGVQNAGGFCCVRTSSPVRTMSAMKKKLRKWLQRAHAGKPGVASTAGAYSPGYLASHSGTPGSVVTPRAASTNTPAAATSARAHRASCHPRQLLARCACSAVLPVQGRWVPGRSVKEATVHRLPHAASLDAVPRYVSPSLSPSLFESVHELRHDLKHVAHDAKICNVKDRGVGVFVDGHNRLRRLHSGTVLNGSRYAQRNIQLR